MITKRNNKPGEGLVLVGIILIALMVIYGCLQERKAESKPEDKCYEYFIYDMMGVVVNDKDEVREGRMTGTVCINGTGIYSGMPFKARVAEPDGSVYEEYLWIPEGE